MTRTQGLGDLYREYLGARQYGFEYNLANIPDDFEASQDEPFDPEYMGALFDLGYEMALVGYPWHTAPPGLEPD